MVYLDSKEGILDLYKLVFINIENTYKINKINDMFKTYISEYINRISELNVYLNKDVSTYIRIMEELLRDIVDIPITNKEDLISYLDNSNIDKDNVSRIKRAILSVTGNMVSVYIDKVDALIANIESSIIIAVSANNLNEPIQKKNMHNLANINKDLFDNIERLDGSISKYKSANVKSFIFRSNGEHDIDKPIESAKMINNYVIKTGIPIIDNIYGGLKPSTLSIGFSVTNGGKSVFSTNLLASAWRSNYKSKDIEKKCQGREPVIILFTHENTMDEVFHNILTILLGDDYRQHVPEDVSARDILNVLEQSGEFNDLKDRFSLYVLDIGEGLLSIQGIRTHLNKLRKEGLEPMLLIDDYIGLLKNTGPESKTPLGDLSQGLKNISKEFALPVFTTAQMNFNQVHLIRDYDKDDKISCFSTHCIGKDKTILQPADIGLFIYRTTVHGIDHMSVLINKIRNGAGIYHNGKPRVSFTPYERGFMYKTGSKDYDDIDEMFLDVKIRADRDRMSSPVQDTSEPIDVLESLKNSSNVSTKIEQLDNEDIYGIDDDELDDLIYALEKGNCHITQEIVEFIEGLDPNDPRSNYVWEKFSPWRHIGVS